MDLDDLVARPQLAGTRWSIRADRLGEGRPLLASGEHDLLRTASIGKLYLLVEVAAQVVRGELDPARPVARSSTAQVADSGIWQHLSVDSLPVVDLATLVGAVSDNWATNALLELVGLSRVQQRAAALAPGGSMLHDFVRDARTPDLPPTLSEGTAADLCRLVTDLRDGLVVSAEVSALVLDWMSTSVDLSMVASAFGLDPLSHAVPDRGVRLWNKTGTDDGVRADVGLVEHDDTAVAYAVVCNWPAADTSPGVRDHVLAAMRDIGDALRAHVTSGRG